MKTIKLQLQNLQTFEILLITMTYVCESCEQFLPSKVL